MHGVYPGGSAGGADAVYLPQPEQRDSAGHLPGSDTCGGRDRQEAALEGELARLRGPPRAIRIAGAYDGARE